MRDVNDGEETKEGKRTVLGRERESVWEKEREGQTVKGRASPSTRERCKHRRRHATTFKGERDARVAGMGRHSQETIPPTGRMI